MLNPDACEVVVVDAGVDTRPIAAAAVVAATWEAAVEPNTGLKEYCGGEVTDAEVVGTDDVPAVVRLVTTPVGGLVDVIAADVDNNDDVLEANRPSRDTGGAELEADEVMVLRLSLVDVTTEERGREMFYLTTHSTHFIYGYMASDKWLRTILIVRKETRCRHT